VSPAGRACADIASHHLGKRQFFPRFTARPVEKNTQACFRLVDMVLGGAYMSFTGGGAVVLLCGLAFPDKRIVSALVLGHFRG
jgi:hypothetical protein